MIKKITVMRFLSFSNKKKPPVKRFESGASNVRPGPPARQNLKKNFTPKFTNVRAFPFGVVK
jgi:hypothetical protein